MWPEGGDKVKKVGIFVTYVPRPTAHDKHAVAILVQVGIKVLLIIAYFGFPLSPLRILAYFG